MAKQIAGLCRLVGTIDDITFYKMEGQYYARAKSSLTSKRVKTSPEFKWTMVYARLLARASKIGSQIYKALPPGWRQFWMYRSFTGEAFTLLKENPYNDAEVKNILWKCYVEYWEQRKATGLDNPIFQPKPKKIRKRRKYSDESIQRLLHRKDKYGRYKYPEYIKAEKQRKEREAREAWAKYCEEREQKRLVKERDAVAYALHSELPPAASSNKRSSKLVPLPRDLESLSTWYITHNGTLQTTLNLRTYSEVQEVYNSS